MERVDGVKGSKNFSNFSGGRGIFLPLKQNNRNN